MSVFYDAQPQAYREAIAQALQSRQAAIALLLEFDFISGPVRLSNWNIPITDVQWGYVWEPGPENGQIEDVSGGPDNWAPLRTYSMRVPLQLLQQYAGKDGPFPDLKNKADYQGRNATLFLQLMNVGDGEHGEAKPIGNPCVLHRGRMDSYRPSMELGDVKQEMRVEGFLARKRVTGAGLLTPRDQERRHPGDLGLEYVPEVQRRPAIWPDY